MTLLSRIILNYIAWLFNKIQIGSIRTRALRSVTILYCYFLFFLTIITFVRKTFSTL